MLQIPEQSEMRVTHLLVLQIKNIYIYIIIQYNMVKK